MKTPNRTELEQQILDGLMQLSPQEREEFWKKFTAQIGTDKD